MSLGTLAPAARYFVGHRLKKHLTNVFSSLTRGGAPEKALAKASVFSTKSADRGRNPPTVMKSLRDEILLRRDRRGGFLLVLFIFHYSPFIIHFL